MENSTNLTLLFQKYIDNQCSPEEVEQLVSLLEQADEESLAGQLVEEQLSRPLPNHIMPNAVLRERLEQRLQIIMEQKDQSSSTTERTVVVRPLSWMRVAAAACIIAIAGFSTWFLLRKPAAKPSVTASTTQEKRFKNDVDPGRHSAILTLADGSTMVLDTLHTGTVARQGNTMVMHQDGQLVYDAGASTNYKLLYNTLSTNRGQDYQLVLPDGTKAWLNAASSISFPAAFNGNERRVSIKGEVYFEVVHAKSKKGKNIPFLVDILSAGGAPKETVEVLGTHFNINAYDDEPVVATTLLEGSVRISSNSPAGRDESVIIKPGQQAVLSHDSRLTIRDDIDTDAAIAWKNGLFVFKGADISTIMRQVSRWYDVNVTFEKNITERFYVKLSRNTPVSRILNILETTGGVRFTVEGRKLTVLPGS